MTQNTTTKEFEQAYESLNREQKKAVDTLEGPVMVVAGPGTGKTQTIALRIANILRLTDTSPDSILALTFTDSGARAMRERLTRLIGTPAYYCHLSTFHSFCIDVIKENPDSFTVDSTADPISDLDKLRLIYRLIDSSNLGVMRPLGAPHHYARAALSAISDLKREGVGPKELQVLLDREDQFLQSDEGQELKKTERTSRHKNLTKNLDLHKLYTAYESHLSETHLFDFDDMVAMVVDAFAKDEDLLRTYQERYQYLLVDEYQDTNSAQNDLLLQLASFWGESANLFVVGDPDQCVYRFNGASIENQLGFIKHYKNAEVIALTHNYRSPQKLLDCAHLLISHNNLRINDVVSGLDPHLKSMNGPGVNIRYAKLNSSLSEAIFIAEDIQTLIQAGVNPSDVAVIYRNNADSYLLLDVFSKLGITTRVQGGRNVLEDPVVKNFVTILRVVCEMKSKQEDEDLFTILHYSIFQINPLDILKISRLAGDQHLTLFDVLANQSLLDSLSLATRPALEATLTQLTAWSQYDAEHSFVDLFEEVLNKSGYLNQVLSAKNAHHELAALNTLFVEVKSMNRADHSLNLSRFLDNLRLMQENKIRIEEQNISGQVEAVTLTTAHSSKGLEWEYVYLYRAGDGVWGNTRSRELIHLPDGLLKNVKPGSKEKNEDERRLFYVAATRAKKSLTISHADLAPSLFITELGQGVSKLDQAPLEERSASLAPRLLSSPPLADLSTAERAFLTELVSKFRLSVTSLNTYLECAYKFKLDKLLRVPHSKKPHLAFGTAIHKSLEYFYRELLDSGKKPSKSSLLASFRRALEQEIISTSDLRFRLLEGEQVLSAYYDYHLGSTIQPLYLERSFNVNLADIKLSGKIDRIEWASEHDRTVRVTDYKTGKGKSMGEIEGNTKSSRGDLKRQLVFYKLLIDLDSRLNNLQLGEAVLDFVEEPLAKGKDGRRTLRVTSKEVEDLKQVIRQAMSDIRRLEFPRTTDLSICDKCYFQSHCYPGGLPAH